MTKNSKDITYYCKRCGISFLWTREEQAQAESNGMLPMLCAGCRQLLSEEARERGLVKWFNRRKRFGFIIRADGEEIFAHGSQLQGGSRRLQPGDLVEYSIGTTQKGPAAQQIRLLATADKVAED